MGNPAINDKTFNDMEKGHGVMTMKGTMIKTSVLFAILMATTAWTLMKTIGSLEAVEVIKSTEKMSRLAAIPDGVATYLWIGLLGGFVIGLVTIFIPKISPYTAPMYAAVEGLAVGGITAIFEYMYPGIGLQAGACTLGTFFAMLVVYKMFGLNQKFAMIITAATFGILVAYIGIIIARMFGYSGPLLDGTGWVSILISVAICLVAAFNLLIDFKLIEVGVAKKSPKYMEWYCGFGLLVTIIWLYFEILRLLAKTRSK